MNRKLQVFISSTYTDLRDERAAAVQAVLNAGHIPAGMELFTAGDKSQLETIKQWIDESDVFMLILGARYGSVDPDSGKSYTQIEYEYASEKGMALFAVYMTDEALDAKVRVLGRSILEEDQVKYKAFRKLVMSKICRPFSDPKDIVIATHDTLAKYARDSKLYGWVSGRDITSIETLTEQIVRLKKENAELRSRATGHENTEAASPPRPEVKEYTDDEAIGILTSWMYNRDPRLNTKPIFYDVTDRVLGLPPGTTQKFIEQAAQPLGYTVDKKGPNLIIFQQKPISLGARSSSPRRW